MKVLEIAFTGYCVTDLTRAKSFYEGILGLVPARTFGEPGGAFQWVEYDIGASTLALIAGGGNDWKPSPDGTACALEVDDFTAFVEKIKGSQVKVIFDAYESPVCHMITIADPDGNRIVIHKRKQA